MFSDLKRNFATGGRSGGRLFSFGLYTLSLPKTCNSVIFGQKLTLIDSGLAVAPQTARILIKNQLLFEQDTK